MRVRVYSKQAKSHLFPTRFKPRMHLTVTWSRDNKKNKTREGFILIKITK